jgi:hypothetical protein
MKWQTKLLIIRDFHNFYKIELYLNVLFLIHYYYYGLFYY